nr:hypothetical protein OG781_34730 [Streptomyces sp. NBC_00830]
MLWVYLRLRAEQAGGLIDRGHAVLVWAAALPLHSSWIVQNVTGVRQARAA